MRFRRYRFVPQLDTLAPRIVPDAGAVAVAAPAIAPDDSDQSGSDNTTDPGYGDSSPDDSSGATDSSSSDDATAARDDLSGGSDASSTDSAVDGLYGGGSSDGGGGDDSEYDPNSTDPLDDSDFTVAVVAYGVSAY
jgi:hypothetical protein